LLLEADLTAVCGLRDAG